MNAKPRGIAFAKYEGLGNDFVLIDTADELAIDGARAASLCDRRRGVGADGVLLSLPPRAAGAHARMKVLNADGSVPEMCGNGLRCLALHLSRKLGQAEVRVETDAGLRLCAVEGEDVTVEMGVVRSEGPRTIEVGGRALDVWLGNAGNPHAVLFDACTADERGRLGPAIATHPSFVAGTNADFAAVKDGAVDLVVWERGVGFTLACGTGACATVAVASARGLLPLGRPIAVHLPGGTLFVTHAESGSTTMRGPARLVFTGEIAGEGRP